MQVPVKMWSLMAAEALGLIKTDRLTVEDYTQALVSRIQSRNSVIKAWRGKKADKPQRVHPNKA